MHILHSEKILASEESTLQFHKNIGQDKALSCLLVFNGDGMIDYQKDLFQDFLTNLIDVLSNDDVAMSDAKKTFENGLQDINTKLQVFHEKMGSDKSFPIHGSLQLIFDGDYISSFIGGAGLVILRKEKVHYMLSNTVKENQKLFQFSELVEGEVRLGDQLITTGFPVETYVDKEDMLTIVSTAELEEKNILDVFLDIVQVRLKKDDIYFMNSVTIESPLVYTQKKLRDKFDAPYKKFVDRLGGFEKFQSTLLYSLLGVVVALLLYGLFHSFNQANKAQFVDTQSGEEITITINEIQTDIERFKQVSASSDIKINKYNDIVTKLDTLEENNKRVSDVADLRGILETAYYNGFNIVLANNDSFFNEKILEFTQTEKNNFGTPKQLFFRDKLHIAGTEGALIGATNDQIRGALTSVGVGKKVSTCGMNLLRNGLYCALEDNSILNLTGKLPQPVTTKSGVFPGPIVGLGRFASSNMYVFTEDASFNGRNVHFLRYKNLLSSQENFSEGLEYPVLQTEETDGFTSEGFASSAIDGQFLMWSKAKKALYQLWRLPNGGPELQSREIPLLGGDTVEPYSASTKVIANEDSKYVYLFDKDNQTFTVYRSTPHKTNTAHTYDYSLTYFFRIKFGMTDFDILDIYVDEGEKSDIFLLTEGGVYKMKLHERIEQFQRKEAEE